MLHNLIFLFFLAYRCAVWIQWHYLRIWTNLLREDSHYGGKFSFDVHFLECWAIMLILCGIPIFPLMDGNLPENLWKFKGIIIMKEIYQTRFYCVAVSHM